MAYTWKLEAAAIFTSIAGLTFYGPFGTYAETAVLSRLLFWSIAVLGCGVFFWTFYFLASQFSTFQKRPNIIRQLIIVFATAFPGSVLIYYDNVVLRNLTFPPERLLWLWLTVFITGMIITAVHFYFRTDKTPEMELAPPQEIPVETDTATLRFLTRLPKELGTNLISLSSHDHYVDVQTNKGKAMIYMNFSDAVNELKNYPGKQIHRSFWVSLDAIKSTHKEGRKNFVKLENGKMLPVSEKYKSVLKLCG